MAANFPNSPTNGQQFTVGSITWQWDSTAALWTIVKPIVIPDAPADGKSYTRKNNAWVLERERYSYSGLNNLEIPVPSFAASAKVSGRIFQSSGASANVMARVKVGSTVFLTAGDYNWNGFLHDSQASSFSHYNNVVSGTGAIVTNNGGSTLIPHTFEYDINVSRDSTTQNFDMFHKGGAYGGNTYYIIEGHTNLVSGKTSALRLDALVINFNGLVSAGQSYIDVEWFS